VGDTDAMPKRGEYAPRTLALMTEGALLRGQGMSYAAIGARFGVSDRRVWQVLRRAEHAAPNEQPKAVYDGAKGCGGSFGRSHGLSGRA
jgi:hypothetical protein